MTKQKSNIAITGVFGSVASIIGLLLGLAILPYGAIRNYVQSNVHFMGPVLIITTLLSFLGLSICITYFLMKRKFTSKQYCGLFGLELKETEVDSASQIKMSSGKSLSSDRVKISNIKSLIEREKKATEVWVISPALNVDIMVDIANGEFKKAVEANIIRGVEYRYIVPNTPKVIEHIKRYKNDYEGHTKENQFLLLPKNDFLDFLNEVVIYDPETSAKASFVYSPTIKSIYEDVLIIDKEMTVRYKDRFMEIWNRELGKPVPEQRFC